MENIREKRERIRRLIPSNSGKLALIYKDKKEAEEFNSRDYMSKDKKNNSFYITHDEMTEDFIDLQKKLFEKVSSVLFIINSHDENLDCLIKTKKQISRISKIKNISAMLLIQHGDEESLNTFEKTHKVSENLDISVRKIKITFFNERKK